MTSPENTRALLDMISWEFTDFQDFLKKFDPLKKTEEAYILNTFMITMEGVGTMVKEGFIDINHVATLLGGVAVLFWSRFDHIKEDIREYINWPRWASETEYLYYELLKYRETHPDFKT